MRKKPSKIERGLRDAIAYTKGDKTKGRKIRVTITETMPRKKRK